MGFYFIGEHGIMNWMLTYCMNALQMPSHTASTYLSIFWGGYDRRSSGLCAGRSEIRCQKKPEVLWRRRNSSFVTGVLSGSKGVILLSSSGLLISIPLPDDGAVLPADLSSVSGCYQDRSDHQCCYHCGYCIQRRLWRTVRFYGNQISFLILPVCMVLYYCFYLLLLRVSPSEVRTIPCDDSVISRLLVT